METLILLGILLALLFTFVNGLNNAGNAIATVVATRALSPWQAILLATGCNLAGPFILTTAIAVTIGRGILDPNQITPSILVVGLGSAVALIVLATVLGFPVSVNQALVGGLIGAGFASGGLSVILLPTLERIEILGRGVLIGIALGASAACLLALAIRAPQKIAIVMGAVFGAWLSIIVMLISGVLPFAGILAIVIFIFVAPILGFFAAFFLDVVISYGFRHADQHRVHRIFTPMQVAAAALQGIGHGSNDGQLGVGMITALLVSAGLLSTFSVPLWVLIASACSIALGTLFGGWGVVEKLAKKITLIRPYQGFAAATSGGGVISLSALAGVPVSSTQVISGTIIGVGATRGLDAVQWDVVVGVVSAWISTIPLSMIIAWSGYTLIFTIL